MTPYKLCSKTLKPHFDVLSKRWFNSKEAKEHQDYPKLERDQYPRYRLHVKINHSTDQTYFVSFPKDGNNERGTIQHQHVTRQVTGIAMPGKDVIHMDPDTPFQTVQTAEFCKRLCDVVKVEGIYVGHELVEDVMRCCIGSCSGSGINDHMFMSLEFCTHESYVCFEGVGESR